MTEVFKCRKLGTKCCASKSLIREALGQKDDSNLNVITQPSSINLSTAVTTVTDSTSTSGNKAIIIK